MSIVLKKWAKQDPGTDARIRLIAELAGSRDRLLEAPQLDLAAMALLLNDYESAGLLSCAADLRRRLEHYQGGRQRSIRYTAGMLREEHRLE